jgi:hypothetical protein
MTKRLLFAAAALGTTLYSAEAKDNCLVANWDDHPSVILSGRVTKHHEKVPQDLRLVGTFFLKLDTPILVGIDAESCLNEREIGFGEPDQKVRRWDNKHVT